MSIVGGINDRHEAITFLRRSPIVDPGGAGPDR